MVKTTIKLNIENTVIVFSQRLIDYIKLQVMVWILLTLYDLLFHIQLNIGSASVICKEYKEIGDFNEWSYKKTSVNFSSIILGYNI